MLVVTWFQNHGQPLPLLPSSTTITSTENYFQHYRSNSICRLRPLLDPSTWSVLKLPPWRLDAFSVTPTQEGDGTVTCPGSRRLASYNHQVTTKSLLHQNCGRSLTSSWIIISLMLDSAMLRSCTCTTDHGKQPEELFLDESEILGMEMLSTEASSLTDPWELFLVPTSYNVFIAIAIDIQKRKTRLSIWFSSINNLLPWSIFACVVTASITMPTWKCNIHLNM
jgi:hypothetical protein